MPPTIRVLDGDMRDVVPTLDRIDAVVTDPPYHLTNAAVRELGHPSWNSNTKRERGARKTGFMGKEWDGGDIAFDPATWWPVFTAMKPGAHLVAFGSTRTYHRLVCAIEDAGFEIRDTLCWHFATGFPKSHDISKAIDRTLGAEPKVIGNASETSGRTIGRGISGGYHGGIVSGHCRDITASATPEAAQWQGWGSALKPAMELICLARKPLEGTLAQNTLRHGVGGLHIDACRVEMDESTRCNHTAKMGYHGGNLAASYQTGSDAGRWPSNCLHDGSPEVLEAFAAYGERTSGGVDGVRKGGANIAMENANRPRTYIGGRSADTGSAARFFFSAKADKADRADSRHPTVKPLDLMVWLTKLVCPPGGTVLDPFAGSGVTAEACMLNGFDCILVEQNPEYCRDIRHRIRKWSGMDTPLFTSAAE